MHSICVNFEVYQVLELLKLQTQPSKTALQSIQLPMRAQLPKVCELPAYTSAAIVLPFQALLKRRSVSVAALSGVT